MRFPLVIGGEGHVEVGGPQIGLSEEDDVNLWPLVLEEGQKATGVLFSAKAPGIPREELNARNRWGLGAPFTLPAFGLFLLSSGRVGGVKHLFPGARCRLRSAGSLSSSGARCTSYLVEETTRVHRGRYGETEYEEGGADASLRWEVGHGRAREGDEGVQALRGLDVYLSKQHSQEAENYGYWCFPWLTRVVQLGCTWHRYKDHQNKTSPRTFVTWGGSATTADGLYG